MLNQVQDIREGNQKAFEAFYALWSDRVFFLFLKKTGSEADAADLTQQTFIKMWQYRSGLSDAHAPETMLFQNARLVFIDWLRKEATQRKRRAVAREFDTQIPPALPDHENLHLAIQQLPAMRRKVIRLKHLEGYSYKEIAVLMNLSVKTVDNHVRQALKQLRRMLTTVFFFL